MAHLLARDLGCRLELVPFRFPTLAQQLQQGDFDLAMSGIVITAGGLETMRFSYPYMDVSASLVVRDFERQSFRTLEELRQRLPLRVAVVWSEHARVVREFLPQAEVVQLEDAMQFFSAKSPDIDALCISAEAGSAWTLVYPEFSVVVPQGIKVSGSLAYPMAKQDAELADFVSQWVRLKQHSGEFSRLYTHWILGRDTAPQKPRWSIATRRAPLDRLITPPCAGRITKRTQAATRKSLHLVHEDLSGSLQSLSSVGRLPCFWPANGSPGGYHAVEPNLYFGSDREVTPTNHPGSDEWR